MHEISIRMMNGETLSVTVDQQSLIKLNAATQKRNGNFSWISPAGLRYFVRTDAVAYITIAPANETAETQKLFDINTKEPK